MSSDLIPKVNTTLRLIKNQTGVSYSTQYGDLTPDPIQVKALVPEDFLLYKGRPTVPLVWCRSTSAVTIDGTFVSSSRPVQAELDDLESKMFARFYAAGQFYDNVSGTWTPSLSKGNQYLFTSPPGMSPSLEDISYVKNKEIIRPDCLMFSYADYLKSNFDFSNDVATSGFTMYMVGLMQGTETGCILAFNNGFEIAHNSSVFLTTDQLGFDYFPGDVSIQQMKPFYLVLSVDQNNVTVFLSSGSGNLYSKTTTVDDPTWAFDFMIGKSYGKNPGYAQMSLMDFGIFDYPMVMPASVYHVPNNKVNTVASNRVVMPPDIVPLNNSVNLVPDEPDDPDVGEPVTDVQTSTPLDHMDVSTLIASLSAVYGT